jgi:BED zinc finger
MSKPIFRISDIVEDTSYGSLSEDDDENSRRNPNENNSERSHEVEQDEEVNVKHNTKRSWIWNHFVYDETVKKARCIHCKTLICTNKGSTSGMTNHVKTRHNIIKNQEHLSGRQLTLQESISSASEVIVSNIFIFILIFKSINSHIIIIVYI